MKRLTLSVLILGAIAGAIFWLSPYWVLDDMAKAAVQSDEARFSSHVNYPALRTNAKAKIKRATSVAVKKFSEGVVDTLGAAFGEKEIDRGKMSSELANAMAGAGGALLDATLDAVIGPKTLMAAMEAGRKPNGQEPGQEGAKASMDWSVSRRGMDEFAVPIGADKEDPDGLVVAVFRREGMLNWRLVNLEQAPVSASK